jgi:hypothetical protein
MFSLSSLFKSKVVKGPLEQGNRMVKVDKLGISSNEKPFNSTVVIPSNYDVCLFSASIKARDKHGNLLIPKNNENMLGYCKNNKVLPKLLIEEYAKLSVATANMVTHSVLVHQNEHSGYADFVIKTSKNKPFYFKPDESDKLEKSGVLQYGLVGCKPVYISGIKYRVDLTTSYNIFDSFLNDPNKLAHYDGSGELIASMIAFFNEITRIAYVNKLAVPGFHLHYSICDSVYRYYLTGAITFKEWNAFYSEFNIQLTALGIPPYHPENNLNNLINLNNFNE